MVTTTQRAAASADDVKVLAAGAFEPVVKALAPVFEQRTGHKLVVDHDTAGGLVRRILDGETFDVLVAPPSALEAVAKAHRLAPGPQKALARGAIGVAVPPGAPRPDIGSVAAFKRALLAARAVATIDPGSGDAGGIHLWQWFEKEGLAPQLRAKAVLVFGGPVARTVVNGEADLAIHQVSEIKSVPGAVLVGPLPAEIQNYTVYAGGVAAGPRNAGASRALLALLAGPEARTVCGTKGMEAP
jgi:molybdate transport system substrate-binding protein